MRVLSLLKDFLKSLAIAVAVALCVFAYSWPPTPTIMLIAVVASQFAGWFSLAYMRIKKWDHQVSHDGR